MHALASGSLQEQEASAQSVKRTGVVNLQSLQTYDWVPGHIPKDWKNYLKGVNSK